MNRWTLFVVPMLSAIGVGATRAQTVSAPRPPDLEVLDRYVEQAAQDWRVPGLAIAIVKDDSVVFAKGYGVLDLTKPAPVNEHTRFAIGSTTKAMTAAALGMLVDEGKLGWDDRIIDHLPGFRLYDPYATRELTVRDLLTHRSGLPGTDLLWARGDLSPAEMIRRLRHVEPASSFRSEFEYQNNVYAISGTLIETISGMPWEDFIRTRIFGPLGMSDSEPLVAGIESRPNVATPHANVRDTIRAVAVRSTDPIASAGSVWSSVADMAKWMRFILDSGRVGEKRLLTQNTFSELVTPQIRAPVAIYPALALVRPHVFTYGFGWFVQDYRGETVWMHTGSINGMSAIIGLLPDRRMGVYVLANLDHAELRHALMYKAFDLYAGNPERDWSTDLRELFARARTAASPATPRPGTAPQPSLPLERYPGRYVDSTYGEIVVTLVEGGLRARFGEEDLGGLEPWQYEVFLTGGPSRRTVTFVPDGRGNIASLQMFGITFVRARGSNR